MKKINSNAHGYTLAEITLTIIIIGVLASLAIPRYTTTLERVRSGEAVQILQAVYSAQKTYQIENSSLTYTDQIDDLDVTVPTPKDFKDLTAVASNVGDNGEVATITRNTDEYSMTVLEDGSLCCDEASATGICVKVGYAACP